VFEGVLDRVEGILDPATRAGRARIVVANPDGRLRANTFARVRLLLPAPTGTALVLPREAVLDDAGASFVFVRARESYFVRRTVTLGRAHDGWIEVSGALKTGDEVVARGAFLLKSDVLREKMGAGCAD
jgi:cobalt-zinc-cadmium efflux system membrane fusion protein